MRDRRKKPNGVEIGTFFISIDDGFVEYQYKLRIPNSLSIALIHEKVCEVLLSKKFKGRIRVR